VQLKFDEAAIRYHCQLLHHVASRAGIDGKLILAAYGKSEDGERALPPVVQHFAIGESENMVSSIMAFEGSRYNVYTPWGIRPNDLAPGKKGAKTDVIRLLALVLDSDADKGQSIAPLIPADYVIQTSTGNFQYFHILDSALERDEAEQFGNALKRATKAEFAEDTSHIWRVPGTVNVTDKGKWERGRPKFEPVRLHQAWNQTFADTGKLKAILHPHWEAPRPEPTAAQQSQYDNDPAKVEALFVRLRDAGYFDAGDLARRRYTRAAKALSYDLGDVGRDIWERVVCWQGDREDEGIPVSQDESDERWKDCSKLPTGVKPLTLGTFKDDVHKALGWPLRDMYTEREKSATAMFGTVATNGQILQPQPGNSLVSREPGAAIPISEDDIALSFADVHNAGIRYVDEWARWLEWRDGSWHVDKTISVFDLIRRHVRSYAGSLPNQDARKLTNAKTVAAVEKLAKSDRRIAASADVWDGDDWLLNTPGGVVDLRTGVLRQAAPGDYMTKRTAVAPGGDCPQWKAFLHKSLGEDADLIAFVQRVLGYTLTGSTQEEALFFCHGNGGNGKGVLMKTVAKIMGDYAKNATMTTFTETKYSQHLTELARLRGPRLVTASETESGQAWAETKLKTLTGNDPITANFMRQDHFEFDPKFKLIIAGNHRPRLKTVDPAIRRRFNLIPFTVDIPKEERDEHLKENLQSEWPGILAWMIEGCLAWQRQGLNAPESVLAATNEYMESEDAILTWLAERCDRKPNLEQKADSLFSSWSGWARFSGEQIGTKKEFYAAMRRHGFEGKKQNDGLHFFGLKEKPLEMPAVPGRPPASEMFAGAVPPSSP
jgi:putative DNA primase/helicase